MCVDCAPCALEILALSVLFCCGEGFFGVGTREVGVDEVGGDWRC